MNHYDSDRKRPRQGAMGAPSSSSSSLGEPTGTLKRASDLSADEKEKAYGYKEARQTMGAPRPAEAPVFSDNERKRVYEQQARPYYDAEKKRLDQLNRDMQRQGLRFWSGREGEIVDEYRETQRLLGENVAAPMIQFEKTHRLDRRRQRLAEKEQGEASAARRAELTGKYDGEDTVAGLNAAVDRALRQGSLTGEYVDPQTGETYETLAKQAQAASLGFEERRVSLEERGQEFTETQTTAEFEQRRDEFAAQLGLSRDQLNEAIAARRAGNELDDKRLQAQIDQFESDLEFRSVELGQRRDEFAAQLGLNRDELDEAIAARRAGNELDDKQLQAQIDQFERDLSYRSAELSQRKKEFAAELGLSQQELQEAIDARRAGEFLQNKQIEAQIDQFEKDLRLRSMTFGQRQDEFAAELGLSQKQFEEAVASRKAGDELQNKELQARIDQFRQEYGLSVRELEEGSRRFDTQEERTRDEFAAQLGLSRDQFDQAIREFNAGFALEDKQLQEQVRQFNTEAEQRESEFARSLGLSREELAEQQRQFEVSEQNAMTRFTRQTGLDEQQFAEARRQFDLGRTDQLGQFEQEMGLREGELAERIRQFNKTAELEKAELTGRYTSVVAPADFGIDTSSYLDGNGNVTNWDEFFQAADYMATNFEAIYGRKMTPMEGQVLARGDSVGVAQTTLAAEQFKQTYSLSEQELDIERERVGLSREQLAEENRQFNAQLEQRESEFAAEIGLDREQLQEAIRAQQAGESFQDRELEERIKQYNQGLTEQRRQFNQQVMQRNHEFNKNHTLDEQRLDLEKGRQAFDERMAEADRTGKITDPITGRAQLTVAAQAEKNEQALRSRGLDLEADQLTQSADQFDRTLRQEIFQFAQTNGLNRMQAEATVANVYAQIEQNNKRIDMEAEQLMAQLTGRTIDPSTGRVMFTAAEAAQREQFEIERERIAATTKQQEMDRQADLFRFAQAHGLDRQKFEQAVTEADRQFGLTAKQVAQEYDLDIERFNLGLQQFEEAKQQADREFKLGSIDRNQRQQQIDNAMLNASRDYNLDYSKFQVAQTQWSTEFKTRVEQINSAAEFQKAQFEEAKRQFDTNEGRREAVWKAMQFDTKMGDGYDPKAWQRMSSKDKQAVLAFLNGGSYSVSGGGGGFWGAIGGITGAVAAYAASGGNPLAAAGGYDSGNRLANAFAGKVAPPAEDEPLGAPKPIAEPPPASTDAVGHGLVESISRNRVINPTDLQGMSWTELAAAINAIPGGQDIRGIGAALKLLQSGKNTAQAIRSLEGQGYTIRR